MKVLSKFTSIVLIIFILANQMPEVAAAGTVNVTQSKVVTPDEATRSYKVDYTVNVSYDKTPEPVVLVLVFDRSTSMLYETTRELPDGSTRTEPVVQQVWESAEVFIDKFFANYPTGQLALTSYGTNAVASDNWKTVSNVASAKLELNEIYGYTYVKNKSGLSANLKKYKNDGLTYGWNKWNINQKFTNIKSGFDYAEHLLTKGNSPKGDATVVMFTDGVANRGGDNGDKSKYFPEEHNSNTLEAIDAAKELMKVADVVTIGYFGGISPSRAKTKDIAIDTLKKSSSNDRYYIADELTDMKAIFDEVVSSIDYVGTNGYITDVIENEFELVPGSYDANAILGYDDKGKRTISWKFATLKPESYHATYKVRAKDSAYPSGTGTYEIPLNEGAKFSYENLEKNPVDVDLGVNMITVPSLNDEPQVEVSVNYAAGTNGYLIGDTITATHNLRLKNHKSFDYIDLEVGQLRKSSDVKFNDYFDLTTKAENLEWSVNDKTLKVDNVGQIAVANPSDLDWSASRVLEFIAKAAGNYDFKHEVDFSMGNKFGVKKGFTTKDTGLGSINVKKSLVNFSITDDLGVGIDSAVFSVVGTTAQGISDVNGQAIIEGLTTAVYEVRTPLPSGYELASTAASNISVDVDEIVISNIDLNYNNATPLINIPLNRLQIKDIYIRTLTDASTAEINYLGEMVDGKVIFTTMRELDLVRFELIDHYLGGDLTFILNRVENSSGGVISDFKQLAGSNTIEYIADPLGGKLDVDTYTVYGAFVPPTNFPDEGIMFDADINEMTTKDHPTVAGPTPVEETYAITAHELEVTLASNADPVISVNRNDTVSNRSNYSIELEDDLGIAEYIIVKGEHDLVTVKGMVSEGVIGETISYDGTRKTKIEFDYDLIMDIDPTGLKLYEGKFTIYVKDITGNEVLLVTGDSVDPVNIDLL